jgi:hypothetical protein
MSEHVLVNSAKSPELKELLEDESGTIAVVD